MTTRRTQNFIDAALFVAVAFATTVTRADDPLPSWNDGTAKKSLVAFVEKVTKAGSPDFVPVAERIATFDNDGALWCEEPMPGHRHDVRKDTTMKATRPQILLVAMLACGVSFGWLTALFLYCPPIAR